MAKKKVTGEVKIVEVLEENTDNEALIKEAVDRFERACVAEKDERAKGIEDINFINSEDQWDDAAKTARGPGRIALTINTLPTFLDQIDGDMRRSRPGISINPVDNGADKDTAEVLEGLIRCVERNSNAPRVYSYGGMHASAGGRGAWRVRTDYISETSFQQMIMIERIDNPYSVYFDPSARQDDKQDGQFFFIVSDISKEEYKEKFGEEPTEFSSDDALMGNWRVQDNVRIAEYFYRKEVGTNSLCLLSDGRTLKKEDLSEEEVSLIVKERKTPVFQIWWAKIDGKKVLEGPQKIAGNMFPVVLTWGKQLCVNGKVEVRGIARFAKDSCRLYNYFRTSQAETSALQPKQPYLMPDICIGPYKEIWDKSSSQLYPYLPFKVDETQPGMKPYRERVGDIAPGTTEQVSIAKQEIKDTVGIQKAAMGIESNETSGRAIRERKMESDTGQYAYLDNMTDSVRTTGKIILGMIPEIFDTEQEVRILGADMREKVVKVNGQDTKIDLTTGLYDVNISTDKSYSTQREELVDKLQIIMPAMPPEQAALITDLVFDSMDFPKADEIAKRLRKLLPPGILDDGSIGGSSATGGEANDGQPPPQAPPPTNPAPEPQPDPLMVAKVRQEDLKAQQEEERLKGLQLDNLLKEERLKKEREGVHSETIRGNEEAISSAAPQQ